MRQPFYGLVIKFAKFQLSKTDAEDEFNDIADIPTKIAELAKSVHGGDIFGDLPSPRYQHNVG